MVEVITLFEVSAFSAMVPLTFGILTIRKLSKALKILLLFIAISFSVDILSFLSAFSVGHNYYIINIYSIVQALMVSCYFLYIPDVGKFYRKLHLLVLISCFIVFPIIYLLLEDSFYTFNTKALSASSIFIIFHCGIYMADLLTNKVGQLLKRNVYFLINACLFVYHSAVITIFLTFGLFDYDITEEIWNIKLLAYIIFNMFVFLGFYIHTRYLNESKP